MGGELIAMTSATIVVLLFALGAVTYFLVQEGDVNCSSSSGGSGSAEGQQNQLNQQMNHNQLMIARLNGNQLPQPLLGDLLLQENHNGQDPNNNSEFTMT